MFDQATTKGDFPIFTEHPNLAYLDSAATAQKPASVLEAMDNFYRKHYANPHRGVYALAEEATELYESARTTVATFLGGKADELIFCRSATEALNVFVWGWASHHLENGDAVVLTEMEHHAGIVPWHILSEEYELDIRFARVEDSGHLDMADLAQKMTDAKVLSLCLASNVLGTINPVSEAATIAHQAGAKVLVDAAQAAPHLPIDVSKLGADAVAITGHKMLGPMGIGALWVNSETLQQMSPVYGGGGMIKEVRLEGYEPALPPFGMEAGTMPVAEAIGLAAAVRYLEKIGMAVIAEHERGLTQYALEQLQQISGVKIFGPFSAGDRVGLVSFTVANVHAHDLATILGEDSVAIRSGHHCAQPLHDKLGVPATARASFSVYNDTQDVDRLVSGIAKAQQVFR